MQKTFSVTFCLALAATVLRAQEIPAPRGFLPAHSYSLDQTEHLDLATGNLGMQIPLAQLPVGPGGFQRGITLYYNSSYLDSIPTPSAVSAQNDITYYLKRSDEAGWRLGYRYDLELVNTGQPATCQVQGNDAVWKLAVIFPDGGKHVMSLNNGQTCPDGRVAESPGQITQSANETWFSTDGSFLRLILEPASSWSTGKWYLYFPDGSHVENTDSTHLQKIFDRNQANYAEIDSSAGAGYVEIRDAQGRKITIQHSSPAGQGSLDVVKGPGPNGLLTWTISWGAQSTFAGIQHHCDNTASDCLVSGGDTGLVSQIILPNGLQYSFEYLGRLGTLSKMTLPSLAELRYTFKLDGTSNVRWWYELMQNVPNKKDLVYAPEQANDFSSKVTETWTYTFGAIQNNVTAPDGGITKYYYGDTAPQDAATMERGLIKKIEYPDGGQVDRVYANNIPSLSSGGLYPELALHDNAINRRLKAEYRTEGNAAKSPSITTAKIFRHDKNGNVTGTDEYEYVAYTAEPISSGDAAGTLLRTTTFTMKYPVPDSSTTGTAAYHANLYLNTSPINLPGLVATAEVAGAPGAKTDYEYDSSGNMTKESRYVTVAGSCGTCVVTNYAYSFNGNLTSRTDPRSNQTTFAYQTITQSNSNCAASYTDLYVTSETRPLSQTSTYAYNSCDGQRTGVTDPNLVTLSTVYDDYGRPLTETQGGMYRVSRVYSDANRYVLTKRDRDIVGDGRVISVERYDPLGRLRLTQQLEAYQASIPDETTGIKSQHRYAALCANDASASLNAKRSCRIDSNPYREGETTADTVGWTVQYADQAGRPVRADTYGGIAVPQEWSTLSGANTTSRGPSQMSYDTEQVGGTSGPWRQTVKTTDEASKEKILYRDGLGRLVKVKELFGNPDYETYYKYDSLDNLTAVCQGAAFDGSGGCPSSASLPAVGRSFEYDALKRLTKAIHPERGTVNYGYDANGNLLTWSDDRGYSATTSYDALNRPTSRTYSPATTPAILWCYDNLNANCTGATGTAQNAIGRLTVVMSGISETHYLDYDPLGRVTRSKQRTDSVNYMFGGASATSPGYQWSADGHLVWMKYPSGREVVSSIDDAGRYRSIAKRLNGTDTNYWSSSVMAAHGGVRTALFGTGQLTEQRAYTSRLQADTIAYANTGGTLLTVTNHYCPSAQHGACATNNGNVVRQDIAHSGISAVAQTYGYDNVNRLSSVSETGISSWNQTYSYDAFGNRAVAGNVYQGVLTPSATSQYDAGTPLPVRKNRWLPGTTSFDAAGNQLTDDSRSYTYDHENRLKTATLAAMSTSSSYDYDGEGRRVRKTGPGGATIFVYDGLGRLMAEYPAQAPADTGLKYVAKDHLGSTRMVTDGAGAVRNRYDYFPFGEEIGQNLRSANVAFPGAGYPSTVVKAVKEEFTGKERDAETGLDYFGARYYGGAQGRFTSADKPFADQFPEDPQSWNMYAYVRNNPLAHIDTDGQACFALNSGSAFCGRATEYGQIDAKVSGQTRFFAAASAVSQSLADSDVGYGGFMSRTFAPISGSTQQFLGAVGQDLLQMNRSAVGDIQSGKLTGPDLDSRMVHMEQSKVQGSLDSLKKSDPAAYQTLVKESNAGLNPSDAMRKAGSLLATDKAYLGVVDGVRKNLGRNIDFSRQGDREAIGNALIQHIRQTGGCDVAGDKLQGCH